MNLQHTLVSTGLLVSAFLCASTLPTLAQGGTIEAWGNRRILPGIATGYTKISADRWAAGVKLDGSLDVWGESLMYNIANVPEPNNNYVDVSVGVEQIVALRKDGSAVVWGRNDKNQCYIPEPNSGFVAVIADVYHDSYRHCAGLKADGTVVLFGKDVYQPQNLKGLVSLETNKKSWYIEDPNYTMGLKADGSIVYDGYSDHSLAHLPEPNTGFVKVSCGTSHAIALRKDGTIAVWGNTSCGQGRLPSPNSGFIDVAAASNACAALRADGSVVCWGDNTQGSCNLPVPNEGFVRLSSSRSSFIGFKRDGSYVAWNQLLPLTNRLTNSDYTKISVYTDEVAALKQDGTITGLCTRYSSAEDPNAKYIDVAQGSDYVIGLKDDGTVTQWSSDPNTYKMNFPNSGFTAVAANSSTTVALKQDGSVVCWGRYSTETVYSDPNHKYIAISCGGSQLLMLKDDGTVVCKEVNCSGQKQSPTENHDFVAIAAGADHSMALRSDGSIICWGANAYGQCNVPAPNQDFVRIYAGQYTSIGIKSNGTIVTWGTMNYTESDGGIISAAHANSTLYLVRREHVIHGHVDLTDYIGDKTQPLLSVAVSSPNDAGRVSHNVLMFDKDGNYSMPSCLKPPYNIVFSSPHFVPVSVSGTAGDAVTNISMVNGDANGDGQVNLFDYVVLDQNFDTSDGMADLNGDGQVNLFDYVVVDRSFGTI